LLRRRIVVRRLVSELDRLPALTGSVACPFDDGSEIVALLVYPHGRHATISVGLTGCAVVTNGRVHRTAAGRRSFLAHLELLA
jgi:hypothetical protein